MNIAAVENIPYAESAFASFGRVTVIPDKALSPAAIKNTDILLVRSTRKINEALLAGSPVKFVGTATIGYDHVDTEYLNRQGIYFCSAPGSNANSVSEYITAALLELAHEFKFPLNRTTIGVIGCGNVGSRVVKKARALGMNVLVNDPPLARRTGDKAYLPLKDLFETDIITVHVPLIKEGEDKTRHLADEAFLDKMKPGSILINTSRGAVVDTAALHRALNASKLKAAVLDVWENEPTPDLTLIPKTFIATHHIAGHSFDGKVNGTLMLYNEVCKFLNKEPIWDPAPLLPPPLCPQVHPGPGTVQEAVRETVKKVYDIWNDDRDFRTIADKPAGQQGPYFSGLRNNYPVRREFYNTKAVVGNDRPELKKIVDGLGFKV